MNGMMGGGESFREQLAGKRRFHVVTRAASGMSYPNPGEPTRGYAYALPCRIRTLDMLPATGNRLILDEGHAETVVLCQHWHPEGTALIASEVDGQLYASIQEGFYNVRVYEADGSVRWSHDFQGWWSEYENHVETTAGGVAKVAAGAGRVFAVGWMINPEFGAQFGLKVLDAADGTLIRQVNLARIFPLSPVSLGGDAYDVRLNGTAPTFADATEVWVMTDWSSIHVFDPERAVQRFDLDGNYLGFDTTYNKVWPSGISTFEGSMTQFSVRPDGVWYPNGQTLTIPVAPSGTITLWHQWYMFGDDLTSAAALLAEGTDEYSMVWYQDDQRTPYFVATFLQNVSTPYCPGVPLDLSIRNGNLLAAHSRVTRLINGNLEGTTGTSATGAISMWDQTGNCHWLKDVAPGQAISANCVCWLSDGNLLAGGAQGYLSKMDSSGNHVWTHRHMVPNNCTALPDGASAVGGHRHPFSSDVSYV